MNEIETPRTQAVLQSCEQNTTDVGIADLHIMFIHAKQLECELTALTEQRDRLAEALRKFVGDALFCSHANTATDVTAPQQVDDIGDALTMP